MFRINWYLVQYNAYWCKNGRKMKCNLQQMQKKKHTEYLFMGCHYFFHFSILCICLFVLVWKKNIKKSLRSAIFEKFRKLRKEYDDFMSYYHKMFYYQLWTYYLYHMFKIQIAFFDIIYIDICHKILRIKYFKAFWLDNREIIFGISSSILGN